MKSSPAIIDGASVLFWADITGIAKTNTCTFLAEGQVQKNFAGLAIAQYNNDPRCYLFLCDEEWETQNDTLHENLEEARAFAEALYPGISSRWRRAAE